jgi:hypothetical protein
LEKGYKAAEFFINNSGSLDYLRTKIAVVIKKWLVKLLQTTANGPQRSRCSEIGLPEGEKILIKMVILFFALSFL